MPQKLSQPRACKEQPATQRPTSPQTLQLRTSRVVALGPPVVQQQQQEGWQVGQLPLQKTKCITALLQAAQALRCLQAQLMCSMMQRRPT
jgi:hypothetical protein